MGAREKDLNPDVFIGLELPLGYSDSGFFKQTKTTLQQAKYNIVNFFTSFFLGGCLKNFIFAKNI